LQNSGGFIQLLKSVQDEVESHIEAGKFTIADAEALYDNTELLFPLADRLRKKAVGEKVTYVINRNINFTNMCIGTCRFCAFRKKDGYLLSNQEILEKIKEAAELNATEICIQGGLLTDWDISDYCEMLETIKEEFPWLHIHAFSPMEVLHAARNANISVKEALVSMKKSGLGSLPGTAAEILVERVRKEICPEKLTTHEWIDVVKNAHRQGIPTTATIMYGHIETLRERFEHLLVIREIQKKTGGFTEFVPLPFMPYNNKLGEGMDVLQKLENMKFHAIARIFLYPHIKNIQVSWVKLGKKQAVEILNYGANDLGGTLMEENISRSAGAANGEYMAPAEFERLICRINRIPQQRDTLYKPVKRS
jgi:FO synthase subunit 2